MKKKHQVTLIDSKGWKKKHTVEGKPTLYLKMPLLGCEYTFELQDKDTYRQTQVTYYA